MRNQTKHIEALFKSHPNEWIALPEIMRYAAQYNARLHELRGAGMVIQNKTKTINGEKHSWYLYAPDGQMVMA